MGAADVGIKVSRLPIRVRGTSLTAPGEVDILFEKSYGFCYAGSLANAGTFFLLIQDLFWDVQFATGSAPLSFESICDFLRRFSEMVSTEVVSRLAEAGGYSFFIAGSCPRTGQVKGAHFQLAQHDGQTVATFSEVVQREHEFVALGSGGAEFERLMQGREVSREGVLLTLDRLISQGSVPSVGGDLQYGSFRDDNNFHVLGIKRVTQEMASNGADAAAPVEQRVFRYRGFELPAGLQVPGGQFWPSPEFLRLSVPSTEASRQRFQEELRRRAELAGE
jgi:hypothetical protein